MRRWLTAALEWLHARTGIRHAAHAVLDEPLPPGTGWLFTLGSVLLLLLGVQALTGVVLALFYAPTPDHAWSSVRFITTDVRFGRIIRNLHFFGASFIVVAAVLHALRVFSYGAYKAPREATWISGVVLLLVILAFALTGYLLPWDQRAYWATVVTLNIAASAPMGGELAAGILRGGTELGALTLTRWFTVHVIVLPLVLVVLAGLHLALMRRHHVSGPLTPREGEGRPFFPYHAVKDATVAGAVFAVLLAWSVIGDAPLEAPADPADATFTPRPEWYFLWLFQLLKYFPGPLEPIGTHVVPLLLVLLSLILPFIDRRPERRPWRRPLATGAALVVVGTIGALTWLGLRDVPEAATPPHGWPASAFGGRLVAASDECRACHGPGRPGPALDRVLTSRDDLWIRAHILDPSTIAPGARPAPEGADPQKAEAFISYQRQLRLGRPAPPPSPHDRALAIIGAHCLGCHRLDGEGGREGPRLDRAGRERDAAWLAGWIANPTDYEFDTDMPAFGDRLSRDDIAAVAGYLATRKGDDRSARVP